MKDLGAIITSSAELAEALEGIEEIADSNNYTKVDALLRWAIEKARTLNEDLDEFQAHFSGVK